MLASADVAVLEATRRAIAQLHAMGISYADVFSPLPEHTLRDALRRLTVRVRDEPLGRRELEAVSPPVFGRYAMLVSTDLDAAQRGFAMRHGMGHVVAGHVTTVNFLRAQADAMAPEERVADLFALADVAPFWTLGDLRRARAGWRAITDTIAATIRAHTIAWPAERVRDRAGLRVALYREYGE